MPNRPGAAAAAGEGLRALRHYPFLKEPDRFAGVVAAFLSSAAR